jgi:hypothetical protein
MTPFSLGREDRDPLTEPPAAAVAEGRLEGEANKWR